MLPLTGPATNPISFAASSVQQPGLIKRVESAAAEKFHDELVRHPGFNTAVGNVSGPWVKHMFNAPAKAGVALGPPVLKPATVEEARRIMATNFKPGEGKTLIGISGGGATTVHCFVVSDVTKDGHVKITQAIAQTDGKPDNYSGFGGLVRKMLDKLLHNPMEQMKGVVVEDWEAYAKRSGRNSIVVMELDADPAKAQEMLKRLNGLVGKPYDNTMTAAEKATPSSELAMYCTEISAWFINELRPGTVKMSRVGGYPVFQVPDHMAAADVNGGPLKVLFNGENRLDLKNKDPHPHA